MTRKNMIERLEEMARLIAEELETDEVTDYARERAYISVQDAIDCLVENYEG
jgi:hypothetical protein